MSSCCLSVVCHGNWNFCTVVPKNFCSQEQKLDKWNFCFLKLSVSSLTLLNIFNGFKCHLASTLVEPMTHCVRWDC